jgi:hypothetical protein
MLDRLCAALGITRAQLIRERPASATDPKATPAA